jgi:hypothetical protein
MGNSGSKAFSNKSITSNMSDHDEVGYPANDSSEIDNYSNREDDGIRGNDSYENDDYRVEAIGIMNNKASRSFQAAFVDNDDDDDGSVECLGVSKGPPVMQRYDGVSFNKLSGSTTVTPLRGVRDDDNDGVEPSNKN